MSIINSKNSFFYNHLQYKLSSWKKDNPGKRPFVSIKIFEFDNDKMSVNLVNTKPPEIPKMNRKKITEFKEVTTNRKRYKKPMSTRFDSGEIKEVMVIAEDVTTIRTENKFSVLAFEEDKDDDIRYTMQSYDEVDTSSCNLLEIVNPIIMKPKRIIALPGEEYYFNTPENKIDDELLDKMVDCPVFKVAPKSKVKSREISTQTDDVNIQTQTTTSDTDSNTIITIGDKYNDSIRFRYLDRNERRGLGYESFPDYLTVLVDNIALSSQLTQLLISGYRYSEN